MADEPVKLFATRAERYPQRDDTEIARDAALEILKKVVPLVGDATAYIVSLFSNPFEQRRDQWFKELADGLDRLEAKVDGFTVENLIKDEAFVSATIQATRIAIGTHQQAKREYLRNALLNIAVGKGPNEVFQQVFLNAIEAFSAAHVKVLNVVWTGHAGKNLWNKDAVPISSRNYGARIEIVIPELKGQGSLVQYILTDLKSRGFSNVSGPQIPFPQGTPITNMGIDFLRFVLSSEDLPE